MPMLKVNLYKFMGKVGFSLFTIMKGDQHRRDSHAQGFAKIAPNGRMVTKLGEQGSLVS